MSTLIKPSNIGIIGKSNRALYATTWVLESEDLKTHLARCNRLRNEGIFSFGNSGKSIDNKPMCICDGMDSIHFVTEIFEFVGTHKGYQIVLDEKEMFFDSFEEKFSDFEADLFEDTYMHFLMRYSEFYKVPIKIQRGSHTGKILPCVYRERLWIDLDCLRRMSNERYQ